MTQSRPDEILVAIGCFGNNLNVLRAVECANDHGMMTIGVSGFAGEQLRLMARINVNVPSSNVGFVEGEHVVFHFTISQLRQRLTCMAQNGLVTHGN